MTALATASPEQAAVRDATGMRVSVRAYAGTGKTTTLVHWAHAHPRHRTLYLAFNKAVQLEAARRFPRSVTARTGHSVAFAATGRRYAGKLVPSLRPLLVARAMDFADVPSDAHALYAKWLIHMLQRFLASDAATILPSFAPDDARAVSWWAPRRAVRDTEELWRRMCDPTDSEIGMLHDGYLKIFALQRPRLPYAGVLFDECQDANPVLLQLVQAQTHAQQIWVGDPWQAIYGFRGAINAMDRIQTDQALRLTHSWRFGSAIAAAATRLLQWRDATVPPLIGQGSAGAVAVRTWVDAPHALLARTNAGVFDAALTWLQRYPTAKLEFVGGLPGYRLDLIEDVYRLSRGEPPQDPFLRCFPDWEALKTYAETVDDREIAMRIRVVDRYGAGIPEALRAIRAAAAPQAPMQLSTAHKAKGLEWPTVRLADDFPDLETDRMAWQRAAALPPGPERSAALAECLPQEELNLWYVAVTRAQRVLCLPTSARRLVA